MPLPYNYVQGIDVQRRDFEKPRLSYLRGEFRREGWWYYYLYGFAVKVPTGTLLLGVLAVFVTLWSGVGVAWRDELALLLPAAAILILVSSQTGMNHHFRYALPAVPFAFIWMSRLGIFWNRDASATDAGSGCQDPYTATRGQAQRTSSCAKRGGQPLPPLPRWLVGSLALVLLVWSVYSSLRVYPHSLSYFNELAGGPCNGPKHLLDSNLDWGQDLIFLKQWLDQHPVADPLEVAYFGPCNPSDVYKKLLPFRQEGPRPGWFAVSVNYLHGYGMGGRSPPVDCTWLQEVEPAGRAGYSIYVYQVGRDEANHLRQLRGLPPWEQEQKK